jgi:hypothetical protein
MPPAFRQNAPLPQKRQVAAAGGALVNAALLSFAVSRRSYYQMTMRFGFALQE